MNYSTSPSGFKKPHPKSPTRPVGLPSRLTAPTAASAAKHGEEQKLTRKPSTTTRPPSKISAPKVTAPGRPSRVSIARPESRTSTTSAPAAKGGFLERMMRPTTASASKTHEKPTSPPRKSTTAKPGILQKGKLKVEEAASQVKAAVSNGHQQDEHDESSDNVLTASTLTDQATDEPSKTATPVQEADSSTAELQTPHFEGETLR